MRHLNSKLSSVKIILAVRVDLIQRVFRYTQDSGDQEEKYKSLYLKLRWTESDLKNLLDARINHLFKDKYTGISLTAQDLLPAKVVKHDALTYILDRTLHTPRDVITFFNECIQASEGKTSISQTNILAAEGTYSVDCLRALRDEWSADYPNLLPVLFILKRQKHSFKITDLNINQMETVLYDFLKQHEDKQDYLYKFVEEKLLNGEINELLRELFKIFYKVGIVGIKQEEYLSPYWAYLGHTILEVDINQKATYLIHKAFWRVLGIDPQLPTQYQEEHKKD